MRLSIKSKYFYVLVVSIIALLGIVVMPTYAKFTDNYITSDDVVGFNFDFDIEISNIDEYEEIIVNPGDMVRFNINIMNDTGNLIYYGVWYKMVNGEKQLNDSIQIGKLKGTNISSSGSILDNEDVTASFGIINSTNSVVRMYVGVSSSSVGTSDIEYLGGKKLITGEVNILRDININSIVIDGVISDSLPKDGYYTMKHECSRGTVLSWDPYAKSLTYDVGTKTKDVCSLTFTSSDDYKLLNTMEVGSYVAYVGTGGYVGNNNVKCQTTDLINIESSANINKNESLNSCSGMNVNEELDESLYTYGYSGDGGYKYYTTGWRIAYIKDNKVRLVSAGSPLVVERNISMTDDTYIKVLNASALKFCDSYFVDGKCSCTSSLDGQCDTASTDAWAINDNDFYYMTKAISGVGKRLTPESSLLGDVGGSLGNELFCYGKYSIRECGYNNDLIDNGSHYWFSTNSYNGSIFWNAKGRYVGSTKVDAIYGLRPVISLSSSVYVTGGSGTMEDPYTIANEKN